VRVPKRPRNRAGEAAAPEEARPSARKRGRMRRRLRRQQRVREALLLDLGALVYELHRQRRREPELLQAKAAEVSTVDREVRALAEALGSDGSVQLVTDPSPREPTSDTPRSGDGRLAGEEATPPPAAEDPSPQPPPGDRESPGDSADEALQGRVRRILRGGRRRAGRWARGR
jgi:hypothetical protein